MEENNDYLPRVYDEILKDKLESSGAVLITGYTGSSITYFDPTSKSKKSMSRSAAADDFKKVGNVFISYVN